MFDGFAGWDTEHRYKIRIITSRAYHALFMHNMLIRPSAEELANFGEPDYTIYNAGRVFMKSEGFQPAMLQERRVVTGSFWRGLVVGPLSTFFRSAKRRTPTFAT